MAQQRNQADEMKFCCSVCLDLLTDPVTIHCGHNYCMSCIKAHWDEEDQKINYSCPQCRRTFFQRPVLEKNTMLAELVEELKKTGLQAAPADHHYAGPADVACDVCTGRKLKASKSCLQCLASYCEQHLQPHYQSPAFKKHKLVEASVKLQENICSSHDKLKEIFCRTDQQCICFLCSLDEHKGHDTVSAAAERTEKQKELSERRQRIQQRVQGREKDLKELQGQMETINRSADKAVKDSEKIFTELIHLMEKRRSDVKQQIRFRQKIELSRVSSLEKKLQQELTELKRRDSELEQLSRSEDHTHFLHRYSSMSELPQSTDSPRPNIYCLQLFEDVVAALTAAREKMNTILTETWSSAEPTTAAREKMNAVLTETWSSAEPTTRDEFLRYSQQITLDPNTAGTFLVLSEGNRKVTFDRYNKPYPEHPERFNSRSQVLSRDGLTGRCYWEVEMSRDAEVAVAYKSISRSGNFHAYAFGYNEKSWALYCYNGFTFRHDDNSLNISGPKSSRIGVYLDHSAGILSFYSVSETLTLLHRVQTTFTEPLYVGLYLFDSDGETAELCTL